MTYNTFIKLVMLVLCIACVYLVFNIIQTASTPKPGIINTIKSETVECKNMGIYDDYIKCDGLNYSYDHIETFKRFKK